MLKSKNNKFKMKHWSSIALETVKVFIISSQYSLLDATIFKTVILAWMPESSAKDGNGMIINNYFATHRFTSL
jgi:hypothetical protein